MIVLPVLLGVGLLVYASLRWDWALVTLVALLVLLYSAVVYGITASSVIRY